MARTGKPARVISVSSGKGGVGKTLTTVNLGLALHKLGKRVLLLDADLGLANINIMLGFEPKATLHEVFSGSAALGDIIVEVAGRKVRTHDDYLSALEQHDPGDVITIKTRKDDREKSYQVELIESQ